MKHIPKPLSDRTKEIIFGSLLGDGSLKIHDGYRNARFSFRHSEQQADYFHWKVQQLQEISSANSVFRQAPDGFSSNHKLRYQSLALETLTELHQLVCQRNRLRIRRKWLNRMTPLSLAIWWFDDGSLIANSRKGVLCTDGFNKESVETLAHYLEKVWGVHSIVAPINRIRDGKQSQYWRLWFRSTEELKKFLRIILPHVPVEDMLPKVLLLYKDPKLQQRWISEVVQLTGFSKKTVLQFLRKKQLRWQAFRE